MGIVLLIHHHPPYHQKHGQDTQHEEAQRCPGVLAHHRLNSNQLVLDVLNNYQDLILTRNYGDLLWQDVQRHSQSVSHSKCPPSRPLTLGIFLHHQASRDYQSWLNQSTPIAASQLLDSTECVLRRQTYRMVYDDNLRWTCNTIHAFEPARPSFLIHPSKHDLSRPVSRCVLCGTSPTPLGGEPANCLDNLIVLDTGRGDRNQDNKRSTLCVHHFLERSLADLHG